MKKLIISALFLVLAIHCAVAQNVHKETAYFSKNDFSSLYDNNLYDNNDFPTMFPDGREWKCVRTGDPFFVQDKHFTISVCGDTIVNDLPCKLLKSVYENDAKVYYSVVYENNGKVYKVNTNDDDKLIMLLDFSMRYGDKYQLSEYTEKTVTVEDCIEVNGVKRRRLIINDLYQWVEGIGSDTNESWLILQDTYWGIYYYMESCYDNGVLVFSKDDFKAAATDGINDIREQATDNRIWDINGNPVYKPEKGKVYIKGHKKYVER